MSRNGRSSAGLRLFSLGIAVATLSSCSRTEDVAIGMAEIEIPPPPRIQPLEHPAPPQPPAAPVSDTTPASMLIRTGTVGIRVSTLEPAVAAVQELAVRLDGYVVNSSLQTGSRRVRTAQIDIRVPADRFDEALGGLSPIGDVEGVDISVRDVGEDYVDMEARAATRRQLEERLLDLLARRTGNLEEVLAVERELARVREEIDRYEGRLRYLRHRVSMSTLSIRLHEPEPLLSLYPGENVIVSSFQAAWRNFVMVVASLIAFLGFLVPAGLLLWFIWFVVRRRRRRRLPDAPPV